MLDEFSVGERSQTVAPSSSGHMTLTLEWAGCGHVLTADPSGTAVISAVGHDSQDRTRRFVTWATGRTCADARQPDWDVELVRVHPVPSTVSPTLATLAPLLAVALRDQPTYADHDLHRLEPYDTLGYLRHQLLLIAGGRGDVTASTRSPITSAIAAGFGATIDENAAANGRHRTPDLVPERDEVARAIDVIARQPWRFQPAITAGATLDEWLDSAPSPQHDGLHLVIAT